MSCGLQNERYLWFKFLRDVLFVSVSTPEGASQMMEQVNRKVRQKQPSGLIQGSPLYAPRLANDGKLTATNW